MRRNEGLVAALMLHFYCWGPGAALCGFGGMWTGAILNCEE